MSGRVLPERKAPPMTSAMWTNERDYMDSWVWPSWYGGWYCRIDRDWYATREEAEAAVRKRDREAGIVWPWNTQP